MMASGDVSTDPIAVWCHICNQNRNALIDENTHELYCAGCSSTFVEALGQGVEEFVSISPSNQPDEVIRPVSASPGVRLMVSSGLSEGGIGDQTIRTIIDRIMGINISTNENQESSTLINTVNEMSARSGQPVDIIVRRGNSSASSNPPPVRHIASTSASTPETNTTEENRSSMPVLSATRRSAPATRRRSVTDLLDALLGLQRVGRSDSETSNSELEQILHHILMHEQSRAGVPPAPASVISDLPRILVNHENLDRCAGECNISLEPFVEGDVCVSLPCGHRYKEGEIVKWLEMHATCPVCRITIPAPLPVPATALS
jgi:hypothetical protein